MSPSSTSLEARAAQITEMARALQDAVTAQKELNILLEESGKDLVRACAYEILSQYAFPPNCVPLEADMDRNWGRGAGVRVDVGEWAPPTQGDFRLRVRVSFPTVVQENGVPAIATPACPTVTATLSVGPFQKRFHVAQVERSLTEGLQGVAAALQAALDVEVERKIYPKHVLLQAKQWPLVYPLAKGQ